MRVLVEIINNFAEFMSAIARAMFMAGAMIACVVLWIMVLWGAARWYKNWRLYSKHPIAKRIRTFLRNRREARR